VCGCPPGGHCHTGFRMSDTVDLKQIFLWYRTSSGRSDGCGREVVVMMMVVRTTDTAVRHNTDPAASTTIFDLLLCTSLPPPQLRSHLPVLS